MALLNGFGTESEASSGKSKDVEDERRKKRIQNRYNVTRGTNSQAAADKAAARARIQQRIEAAQEVITQKAAERHGINVTSSEPIPYSLEDLRDMLSSCWQAGMEERRRTRKLKEGGGDAATILREEEINGNNGTATAVEVRPGEASMASPFSCLRSSIDGVEAA